jgi:excisionase family DNA binding protein
VTVQQAAERAEVSAGLVYCWIESGMLPHYRLGANGRRGKIVIAEADLVAFLESMKVGVQAVQAPTPRPARKLKLKYLTLPG